jgi:hypothetical protein
LIIRMLACHLYSGEFDWLTLKQFFGGARF